MGVRQDIVKALSRSAKTAESSRIPGGKKIPPRNAWEIGEYHRRRAEKFRREGNEGAAVAEEKFARDFKKGLISPEAGGTLALATAAGAAGVVGGGELTRKRRKK
jgi:hypothetical protein